MELRLDEKKVAENEVEDPVEVTAEVEQPGTHIVSVAFGNDCYEPDDGFDEIYIDWIEVLEVLI